MINRLLFIKCIFLNGIQIIIKCILNNQIMYLIVRWSKTVTKSINRINKSILRTIEVKICSLHVLNTGWNIIRVVIQQKINFADVNYLYILALIFQIRDQYINNWISKNGSTWPLAGSPWWVRHRRCNPDLERPLDWQRDAMYSIPSSRGISPRDLRVSAITLQPEVRHSSDDEEQIKY